MHHNRQLTLVSLFIATLLLSPSWDSLFAAPKSLSVTNSVSLNISGEPIETYSSAEKIQVPVGCTGTIYSSVSLPDSSLLLGGVSCPSTVSDTSTHFIKINKNGVVDDQFMKAIGTGFNGAVKTITTQNDGKILIGGDFTSFNTLPANRIIRLHNDGGYDNSFITGSGFNGAVNTIQIQSNGSLLVGGEFTSYNGSKTKKVTRIIRLLPDGSNDTSFVQGVGFPSGSTVQSIVTQNNNKILVGGSFTSYNTIPVGRILRLETDGSIDTSFTTSGGFSTGTIYTIAIDSLKRILVGGSNLVSYAGNTTIHNIARINENGTLDTNFVTGSGFTNTVRALILTTNKQIIVGGQFAQYDNFDQNRLARLNDNGSLDQSFIPPSKSSASNAGLNSTGVYSLSMSQTNDIFAFGLFTTFTTVYDVVPPRVSLSTNQTDLTLTDFIIDVSFSETVTSLTTSNISIINGSVSKLEKLSDKTYTLSIKPAKNGKVLVFIPKSTEIKDISDNSLSVDSNEINVDAYVSTAAPGLAPLLVSESFPIKDSQIVVVNTNNPEISGSCEGDTSISLLIDNKKDITTILCTEGSYTLIPTESLVDGSHTISALATKHGITSEPSLFTSFTVDTKSPTLSIDYIQRVGFIDIVIKSSEAISNLLPNSLVLTNAILSPNSFSVKSDTEITLKLLPKDPGVITIEIPNSVVVDIANNPNNTKEFSFVYNNNQVILELVSGPDSVIQKTNSVEFTWETNLSNIATCKLEPKEISFTTCTTQYSNSYTNLPDGSYQFSVQSANASGQKTSLSRNFTIDTTRPTVSLTTTAKSFSNSIFSLSLEFSEDITGFSPEEINITNATISNVLIVNKKLVTALITPIQDGDVTIEINSQKLSDIAGNIINSSSPLKVVYDTKPPKLSFINGSTDIIKTLTDTVSLEFTSDSSNFACTINAEIQKTPCLSPVIYTPKKAGVYKIKVTATDEAGNSTSIEKQITITDPVIQPVLPQATESTPTSTGGGGGGGSGTTGGTAIKTSEPIVMEKPKLVVVVKTKELKLPRKKVIRKIGQKKKAPICTEAMKCITKPQGGEKPALIKHPL